jgi:hypothetical protein
MLKPNALVYVRRNDLFIGGKHISAVKMTYPPESAKYLEIIDPDLFIGTCSEFFSAHGLGGKRVLLVLDQTVVFTKSASLEGAEKDQIDAAIQEYLDSMPYEPGKRAIVHVIKDKVLHIYATNSDIYLALQEALKQSGVKKLTAITPAAVYQIDYGAKPSAVIEQFLEDKEVRRSVDFSTVSPQ